MADSKMIMLRDFLLLSFACLPLAVCVVYAEAPAPADDDPGISNSNTTAAINTSSALPLRRRAGAVAPSMSTRHDLDTAGGGGSGSTSSTLCLHRVSTQAYDGGVPLEDGSGRLLFWKRDGQVWLAEQGDVVGTSTGSCLRVGGKPVIDLRTRVSAAARGRGRGRGLAGVAVDSSNIVYVSYYTNTATVGPDGGGAFLVVDQLSMSWSEQEPTTTAATRVFSMALPDQSSSLGFPPDYYGGQILFRPTTNDPNLYLVTGPNQTNGQFQAEILRLTVGQDTPSGGNGTEAQRHAYASVFGVPRRCEFDVDSPQDLYCAIVKDDQEQVLLVSDPDAPSYSTPPPIPSLLVAIQRPSPETPPSLVGGLLYRGDADTTLAGSYIYMYGSEFWVAGPSPAGKSSTTRSVRVTCSASVPAATTTSPSPSPCRGGDFAGGAAVTSFGQDADKNAILFATDATYQVVAPSLCDAAPTYTYPEAQAPTSNNAGKVIGIVLAALVGCGGLAYGLYKMILIFNCCTITNEGNNALIQMGNIQNNYYYGSKA